MCEYKRIERCIGRYIAKHYRDVVEVGVGPNFTAAELISLSGVKVRCTDIKQQEPPADLLFFPDDVFSPDIALYSGAELVYSIRPAEEMMPSLLGLARRLNCDLLVYHLGFEGCEDGGEKIDCGVILHRYYKRGPWKTPSEQG
jgi:uncharacterized UPF0146 family protein